MEWRRNSGGSRKSNGTGHPDTNGAMSDESDTATRATVTPLTSQSVYESYLDTAPADHSDLEMADNRSTNDADSSD